ATLLFFFVPFSLRTGQGTQGITAATPITANALMWVICFRSTQPATRLDPLDNPCWTVTVHHLQRKYCTGYIQESKWYSIVLLILRLAYLVSATVTVTVLCH
ncbi:hypothetical protein F4815DRAFT_457489, partial [Daldinia loculata]